MARFSDAPASSLKTSTSDVVFFAVVLQRAVSLRSRHFSVEALNGNATSNDVNLEVLGVARLDVVKRAAAVDRLREAVAFHRARNHAFG